MLRRTITRPELSSLTEPPSTACRSTWWLPASHPSKSSFCWSVDILSYICMLMEDLWFVAREWKKENKTKSLIDILLLLLFNMRNLPFIHEYYWSFEYHMWTIFETSPVLLRVLSHILRYTDVSFWQCHGNETLGSVRGRIANKLRQPTDNVQIVAQDKMVWGFFSNLYVLYIYMYSQGLSAGLFCVYLVATVSVLYTL